jgi:hypothetical protein
MEEMAATVEDSSIITTVLAKATLNQNMYSN